MKDLYSAEIVRMVLYMKHLNVQTKESVENVKGVLKTTNSVHCLDMHERRQTHDMNLAQNITTAHGQGQAHRGFPCSALHVSIGFITCTILKFNSPESTPVTKLRHEGTSSASSAGLILSGR